MAAVPANANTLASSPFSHSSPQRIHHAGHFMTRNARIEDSWPEAFGDDRIAVAHATCLNLDAHLSRPWIGNLQLNDFKTGSSRGHLGGFHGCYSTAVVINPPISCLFEWWLRSHGLCVSQVEDRLQMWHKHVVHAHQETPH